MNKFKKVLLTVIMFVCIFTLSGCFSKKAITADEFYNKMKAQNFVLTDVTEQYEKYPHMKKVYVAQSPSLDYQIEFCEITTAEKAKEVYESNKKTFETSLGQVVKGKKNVNTNGYQKYRAISTGHFMALTRIDNTVIYVRVPQNNYKAVSKILKKLGY